MNKINWRVTVCQILQEVIVRKHSLTQAFAHYLTSASSNPALIKQCCFGVLRFYPRLQAFAAHLLNKPLAKKEADIHILLLLGCYQLIYTALPTYAIVSETVSSAAQFKKPWAKNLINALLRRLLREYQALQSEVSQDLVASTAHPQWLLDELQHAWPQDWREITYANNQQPPMTLRVNINKISRADYVKRLQQLGQEVVVNQSVPTALTLKQAVAVEQLSGFAQGEVSVQDEAAQFSALLLDLKPGQKILDACAAPGGKTCHILETEPGLRQVIAVDNQQARLDKVKQNLDRLGLLAKLICADICALDTWWDGDLFDRILLDVPCSATGVIRRHPDIKLLRQQQDIANLAAQQKHMLNKLWPCLKAGGVLLYATCSVLPMENEQILTDFLQQHEDAKAWPIDVAWGRVVHGGCQILPGEVGMDGFYYGRLIKR